MNGNKAQESGGDHEDNADLWRKLKAAKERLYTRSEFFRKYGSPSAGLSLSSSINTRNSELSSMDNLPIMTDVAKSAVQEKVESGDYVRCLPGDVLHSQGGKNAPGDSALGSETRGGGSPVMTDSAPSFIEKNLDIFELQISKCDSFTGGVTNNVSVCEYPDPEELGHRMVQGELIKLDSDFNSKLSPTRGTVKSWKAKSDRLTSDLSQSPVLGGGAAALELDLVGRATSPPPLSLSPDAQVPPSLFTQKSLKSTSDLRAVADMPPTVATAESDNSDEITLRPRNRAGNVQHSDRRQTLSDKSMNMPDHQRVQPGDKPQVKDVSKKENNASLKMTSVKDPKAPSHVVSQSPQDVLEELKRLQEEALAQVGRNRFRDLDDPTANHEALSKVRIGPGTDPNSSVSKRIEKNRMISASEPGLESPTTRRNRLQFQEMEGKEKYMAQWTLYKEDPRVYPKIENGRVVLCAEPTPGHSYIPPPTDDGNPQIGLEEPHNSQDETPFSTWSDWKFLANWEYRPQVCSNYEAFRDWFRQWLDGTMYACWYVDIYHQSFFDGTAHTDGELSLFIPDIDDVETQLDMTDEATRLHYHETAQGYCYNYMEHLQKEQEALEAQRKRARTTYLEAAQNPPEPNPNVPKANIYLRPVEVGDIPELLDLCNWYIRNGTQSVDLDLLNQTDMRQRIDDSKREKLPFIVAVERRMGPAPRASSNQRERILGYALATDFMGQRTTGRYTAELEVFVHHEKKRQGIGRCLMDKLLEVCDPTYIPKRGYFFDSDLEDRRGYSSGGRRKLVRLIFALSYPEDDPTEYKWVKEWLRQKYKFEEQGLLKGVGEKFDKFLNVSYLVRNIGDGYSSAMGM